MKTAKDQYIELMAMGYRPEDIDDDLLCQMMDEEREGLELQAECEAERLERQHATLVDVVDALKTLPHHTITILNEKGGAV